MSLERGLLIFSSFVFSLILLALVFNYLKAKAGGIPKGKFRVQGFKDHKLIYSEVIEDSYFVVSPGSRFDRVEITGVTDESA